MSNLAVQVQVAGAAGTGLTASVWPAGSFWAPPPGRGTIVPATSPTATGTTDGSGDVTLTGLSSVNYWLVVVDARSVTNWFFVSAPYVGGGTYQANIPWSTPTSVTSPVDVRGGDTLGPNGNTSKGPWCPLLHVHEIPEAAVALGKQKIQIADYSGGTKIPHGGTGVTLGTGSLINQNGTNIGYFLAPDTLGPTTVDGVFLYSLHLHFGAGTGLDQLIWIANGLSGFAMPVAGEWTLDPAATAAVDLYATGVIAWCGAGISLTTELQATGSLPASDVTISQYEMQLVQVQ